MNLKKVEFSYLIKLSRRGSTSFLGTSKSPLAIFSKSRKMVSPSKGYMPVTKLYKVMPELQISSLNPANWEAPLFNKNSIIWTLAILKQQGPCYDFNTVGADF